jgi:hypothetical protein
VKDLLETCGWTIECVTGAARPPCLTRTGKLVAL